MEAKEEIIDWLRDAYAMEQSGEASVEALAKSDWSTGSCRTAALTHLTETRQHAQTVEHLLRSLDADLSSFKLGLGAINEMTKSMRAALAHDQAVRELLVSYSMEHFEIACYEAIAAAADAAGLGQISSACREIIVDETRMAETIRRELPRIVEATISKPAMSRAA